MEKNTRPYKAGVQLAEALCETAHILYLLDNRQEYLEGLKDRIDKELELVRHLRRT
ncbi:hypothetical protein ES703_120923 [subsurface metagenome]